MTLDETIKYHEDRARQQEAESELNGQLKSKFQSIGNRIKAEQAEKDCLIDAEEHRQMAEWLKELKRYRQLYASTCLTRSRS